MRNVRYDAMRAHRDLSSLLTLGHPCLDPRSYGQLLQIVPTDAPLYGMACRPAACVGRHGDDEGSDEGKRRSSPGATIGCMGGDRPRSARGGGPQFAGVDAAEPRRPRVAGRSERCACSCLSSGGRGLLTQQSARCSAAVEHRPRFVHRCAPLLPALTTAPLLNSKCAHAGSLHLVGTNRILALSARHAG